MQLERTGACVIQGDMIIGRIHNASGVIQVSGLHAQRVLTGSIGADDVHKRRLAVKKGYSAFLWPNGVVR